MDYNYQQTSTDSWLLTWSDEKYKNLHGGILSISEKEELKILFGRIRWEDSNNPIDKSRYNELVSRASFDFINTLLDMEAEGINKSRDDSIYWAYH